MLGDEDGAEFDGLALRSVTLLLDDPIEIFWTSYVLGIFSYSFKSDALKTKLEKH